MATRRKSASAVEYRKTVLPNGLRVISERVPAVRSVSLGVWADVGSRYESDDERGLSHFVEHMFFKGTRRRTASQVAESLESVGGSINAFTSREHTCFMARILDQHLELGVDVLADITCNSRLTPVNLAREKLVICEEIKEAEDNPSDHIHDLFAGTYWQKQAIGRPILGSIDSVMNTPRSRMVDYINRHYRSESIVVAASGAVPHARLVRLAREQFTFPDGEGEAPLPAVRRAGRRVRAKTLRSDQAHICLGYPGCDYNSDEKLAALTLSNYLGGGMSSVLFQKIRERRGLAYTVFCYHDFYRDSGIFGTYLATDKTKVEPAIELILKELGRVKKRTIRADLLEMVKNQLKGQLVIGLESTGNRMNRLARQELYLGHYQSAEDTLRRIDRITARDLRDVANRYFDSEHFTLAVLGGGKDIRSRLKDIG